MATGEVIACHTKDEFESQMAQAKETHKLVIIDFTATWCGPCRTIAPVFAEYAKKYPDAIFLKVDVDELKEVAEKYSIEAMPTFLFIKDGEKVDSVVGASKEEIRGTSRSTSVLRPLKKRRAMPVINKGQRLVRS